MPKSRRKKQSRLCRLCCCNISLSWGSMLGLRGSPLNRHRSSSSANAKFPADNVISDTAMANNRDSSLVNGDASHLTVKAQSTHQPLDTRKDDTLPNGAEDFSESYSKFHSTYRSDTQTITTSNSEINVSFSKDQQVEVLQEIVISTCSKFIAEFEHFDEDYIYTASIDSFLEFIERQRLTHMPHRGSRWDKVLKWAEFFALQISGYAKALESFVPDSHTAAKLIWVASQTLLELGPENGKALETTFGAFYQLGLSLSVLLRHNTLLYASNNIRVEVGQSFNGMLTIVRDVTLYYHAKTDHMLSEEISLDFNSLFRGQIESFNVRKNHIINGMWKYQLGEKQAMDIVKLRSWLGPHDPSLKKLHENRALTPDQRDEYTCEWFQRRLLDFSRSKDDVLALFGPEGCGKTYLSRWTIERLQRPLGKKTHETMSYSVETDISESLSSVAVSKSLLLQLLEKNIGDESLYHAVTAAYRLSTSKDGTLEKLEDALWNALDIGLDQFAGKGKDFLVIVVDGIDQLKNEDHVKRVSDRLGQFTAKHGRLQAITFSRSDPYIPSKGNFQPFRIKTDYTYDDLRHVAEHAFHGYTQYESQSERAQEAIVEKLVHAAQGNFLWLLINIHLLKKESTRETFEKALNAAKDSPQSIHQLIGNLTKSIDLSKSDTHQVLSWILVAQRPLTTLEIQCLLEVDLQKKHIHERKSDIEVDLRFSLGPLIFFNNNFVRFRHPAIRDYLLWLQRQGTTKLLKPQSALTDLTMRLLAYCKFHLTKHQEPSLELINWTYVEELFSQHVLLEYSVYNWARHFLGSSLHTEKDLQLSADFKNIFPSSALIVMIEWACWSSQSFSFEFSEVSLRVRESIFTENHECVLQSLIMSGSIFRKNSRAIEAGNFFYRASRVGQAVLRKQHTLSIACATIFLSLVEKITVTARTEIVTQKEETLIYVINVYKSQHGQTHDLVIRYSKILAQLYVQIREEHKAENIWREVREIIIKRYGKGSEEETTVSEQLTITLKKCGKSKDVEEYESGIFDIAMELEIWDVRRIELTLQLAMSYEARKEFFMAEELLITLWRRLTEQCHHAEHHHGVEIHIRMIDVALEYARFLRRCHRHEEASSILICVWTEYEEYDFESELLFLRLKVVGELMRAISLLSIAVSVFKKCWGWFRARGKIELTASCEVLITETIEEITTITVSSSTNTTATSSTETVVKEIFESTITRTTVTTETISICKSLISYYMKTQLWSEAIEVTERSLFLIWKFVLSGAGTTALPLNFGAGAIEIAISLAICHQHSHHFHEAEEIYLRIYRACWNSCNIEDGRFVRSCEVLIKFYEEHHHWHKVIEVYQELLVQYRNTLGGSHKLTIRTLYILGSLCTDHGHGPADEYYEEIVTALNHGSSVCHIDALDAMFILCRVTYELGHWQKLTNICKILWETWTHEHLGHDRFSAEFIELLYLRYRYVLEHHAVCEYSVLRQLTIDYRITCIKIFGASAAISVKASIELAQICYRSEKHIHEAVSIYEECLTTLKTTTTTTTSVISSTTITKIKESLTKAYVSICSHDSVSITTIERAIIIIRERFESLKLSIGWAHMETLTCLHEFIHLQLKLKKQESHDIVVRILLDTCVEIIKGEKHSKTLHEAAKFLAGLYISCGLSEHGRSLIEEIRLQTITSTSSEKSSFKFDKAVEKVSYVFIATFEQIIGGQLVSYSEIMADLLTETILYESYHRRIKSEKDTTVILIHAARLRAFLASHRREVRKELLEREAFEIFIKKWQSTIKRRDNISFTFYLGLLEELGKEARNVQVGSAACASSITTVKDLLNTGDVQEAYEVATCALEFINHQRAFHLLQNVPYGFKLSALMVGRGLEVPLKADISSKLRERMLELSRRIIREVLRACKDSKVDFVRLKLRELSDLASLLGEQQNFADLEWLLELLWSSREVHKNWDNDTIVAIGRRFVQARYVNKEQRSRAIRLCEDISYNLRRVKGALDPKALTMSELLSELYTSTGHYREAQGVHEHILRLVVEGDDGDDRTLDTMPSQAARKHLDLLKQSYLRLKGWDKSVATYKELVDSLMKLYKGQPGWKDVQGTDSWNFNKEQASETFGRFAAPREWEFAKSQELGDRGSVKDSNSLRRPGVGVKRATSNWGLAEVRRVLQGMPDGGQERIYSMSNGTDRIAKAPEIAVKALRDDIDGDGAPSVGA